MSFRIHKILWLTLIALIGSQNAFAKGSRLACDGPEEMQQSTHLIFLSSCPAGYFKTKSGCCEKDMNNLNTPGLGACLRNARASDECGDLLQRYNEKKQRMAAGDSLAEQGDAEIQTARVLTEEDLDDWIKGRRPPGNSEEDIQTAGGEGALSIPDDQG